MLAAAILAAGLLWPSPVRGGGVVNNCTETDLRAAMAGGGVVTFACDGTISLASTITNTLDTVLDATGHQVVVSGGNAVRVFYNTTNVSFTLVNLTIANGAATNGAGIFNASGNLNLAGVALLTNVASVTPNPYAPPAEGGAILNRGGTVFGTNCSFIGNCARQPVSMADGPCSDSRGGAILNAGGQLALSRCSFSGNFAAGASGPSYNPYGPVRSSSAGYGGAILNSGTLVADSCAFVSNSAAAGAASAGSTALCGTCSGFPGDYGRNGEGGAVDNHGTMQVNACSFVGNTASGGQGGQGGAGGASTTPGAGGSGGPGGDGRGAAIFTYGAARLVNCTAATNVCVGGTGGTGGSGGCNTLIHQTDGAGGNGGAGGSGRGGFFDANAGLTLVNCTFAGNQAVAGSGGAGGQSNVCQYAGPPGVSGANGSAFGGLVATRSTLVNTILATNSPGGNCSGPVIDSGHNLSSDASSPLTNATTLLNTDPKLGPLANSDGPTLTMALLYGSPAIDAADPSAAPLEDQRGYPRPAGAGPDIGAFEYGSVPLLLSVSRSDSTALDLLVRGNANQWCRLLTSSNFSFSSWSAVATNQIGTDGTLLFHQNCDPSKKCQFYRVVPP